MNEALFAEPSISQPLPHSIEAEQAVLGGLMLKNDAFDTTAEVLSDSDFYSADHQLIFNAMAALAADGQPFDPITLTESLQNSNQLSAAGGAEYLVDLAHNTPSSANIKAYTQIVLERSIVRQLISASSDIVRKGYNPLGWDSAKLLEEAEKRLQEIIENRPKKGGFKEVNSLIKEAVERLDELFKNDADITGLSTGFSDLDGMTSGWQKSDLIIIAGRPSIGKTALCLSLAINVIKYSKTPVLFFSLEMSKEQIMYRLLGMETNINQMRLRSGKLYRTDWVKLSKVIKILSKLPFFIDDTPDLSIQDIRSKIKTILFEQNRIGLIMIDYLQLMQNSKFKSENRAYELSQITRSLKNIAREFNVPIIALSQLSRNVENRVDKKPVLSDLRESGSIEQDADLVIMLHKTNISINKITLNKSVSLTDLIIAKQRNGPTGSIQLLFDKKRTKYINYNLI